MGEVRPAGGACRPAMTAKDLSSYNAFESLIPFHTPDEVDACYQFLETANVPAAPQCPSVDAETKKKVTDACRDIIATHRQTGMARNLGLLLLAGLLGLRRRGGGNPPAGGGQGAGEASSGAGGGSAPAVTRPSRDELEPGRALRGRSAGRAARVTVGGRSLDPEQVWGDSPNAIPMGWIGFGAIPHTRLEPGTRFILQAISAARATSPRRAPGDPFQVVEVGTNMGILAELIADRLGLRVLATDVKDVSGFNGQGSPLVHFRRASALSLPVDDGGADVYVSSFSWEYAGESALDEAFRVLPPGGTFVAVSHYHGSSTSRSVVGTGRMQTRILEMMAMRQGSDKKFRAYRRILEDIEAGQGIDGNWMERMANRRALPRQARDAFMGTLSPKWRAALDLMAVAGRQLEWIVALSEEEIRRVFEAHGFDVVEMRPVDFRPLGGIIPVSTHRGLGVVARKRGGPSPAGGSGGGKGRFGGVVSAEGPSPAPSADSDGTEGTSAASAIDPWALGSAVFTGVPWTVAFPAPTAAVAY